MIVDLRNDLIAERGLIHRGVAEKENINRFEETDFRGINGSLRYPAFRLARDGEHTDSRQPRQR